MYTSNVQAKAANTRANTLSSSIRQGFSSQMNNSKLVSKRSI